MVIPARNEAAVIQRCLDSLFGSAGPGEIKVVVACNGCTDDTAEVARRSGWPVKVLELPSPSKPALRAAGEAAASFPGIYLDVDIVLSGRGVRLLLRRSAEPGALAARLPIRFDSSRSPWVVRRFYAVLCRLPSVMRSLWSAGVYGLSAEGRGRFGLFPDVIAEDLYVDRCYRREGIEIVDTDPAVKVTSFVSGSRQVLRVWGDRDFDFGGQHVRDNGTARTAGHVLSHRVVGIEPGRTNAAAANERLG